MFYENFKRFVNAQLTNRLQSLWIIIKLPFSLFTYIFGPFDDDKKMMKKAIDYAVTTIERQTLTLKMEFAMGLKRQSLTLSADKSKK